MSELSHKEADRPVRHAVITATRNRLNLLRRSIESVRSQSNASWRLIVVNDGSTDGTKEYLNDLAQADSKIIPVHREKNGGMQAAFNSGLAMVEADELVSFLDDDDYFLPGALEIIGGSAMNAPSHIDVFFFNTNVIRPESTSSQGFKFDPGEHFYNVTYEDVMRKSRITGDCHLVICGRIVTGNNTYRFSEDIGGFPSELFMQIARDGIGIRFVNRTVKNVDHSYAGPHLSNEGIRRNPAPFVRANLRIFKDHRDFFRSHPDLAASRALGAIRVTLRARDPKNVLRFTWYFIATSVRSLLRKN